MAKATFSSWAILKAFLRQEWRDLLLLCVYALLMGALFLAVPLATEMVVNAVTTGLLLQPLLLTCGVLLAGLVLAGWFRVAQMSIVEYVQRRVFVRLSMQLAQHCTQLDLKGLANDSPPELMNRFFDTLTVQKGLAKLLGDAPVGVLQIAFGLLLLSLYSPWLWIFVVLFLLGVVVVVLLGVGALQTSYAESSSKYRMAQWLQDLAHGVLAIKFWDKPVATTLEKTNTLANSYLGHRADHFKVLLRQAWGNYIFEALAVVGVLLVGGWLVGQQQLTLGQLVAAEILVVAILSALDKLVQSAEVYYDLMVGFAKINTVLAYPTQGTEGVLLRPQHAVDRGFSVTLADVSFAYGPTMTVIAHAQGSIAAGDRVALIGRSGAGKTTLGLLAAGFLTPARGHVLMNGQDVRDILPSELQHHVAWVGESNAIFAGTIRENLLMGRHIAPAHLDSVLAMTVLDHDLATFPAGLDHPLTSLGRNVSLGQRQRIALARALLGNPHLLCCDEALSGMDDATRGFILEGLIRPEHPWTLLMMTQGALTIAKLSTAIVLDAGRVVAWDSVHRVVQSPESGVASLFPTLPALLSASGGLR